VLAYFAGEDTYHARQEIAALSERERASIVWLDTQMARDLPPREWPALAGSLFEKKIVVVRHVELLPSAAQESVIEAAPALSRAPALVILWEEAQMKKNKLRTALKAHVTEYAAPALPALVAWLQKEAELRGSAVEKKAAEALIDRVGSDRYSLLSELEKLALRFPVVTVQIVQEAVPARLEATIFALLDAVVRGNHKSVTHQAESLLESGAGELYIISMLAYQFRTLLTIRQGRQKEAGLKPFVVQKNTPIAERFSTDQLLDILTRILAADFSIKQGTVEARTALWLLVNSLTAQMQSRLAASRFAPVNNTAASRSVKHAFGRS